MKSQEKTTQKEQVLVRLTLETLNQIRDVANERKKAKSKNATLAQVIEELIILGFSKSEK